MVRTRGPLFGQDASGSIKDSMTYSSWKGRTYAKKHAAPKLPPSDIRQSMNACLAYLVDVTFPYNDENYPQWLLYDPDPKLPPYNKYLRFNLERWRTYHAPALEYPALEAKPAGTGSTITYAAGVHSMTVGVKLTTVNDNAGVVLFASQTTGFTPSTNNARRLWYLHDTNQHYWVDAPWEPGVWYVRMRFFSEDGAWGGTSTQQTKTILD